MTADPQPDPLTALVRAAISNAYYDARNAGESMEVAADVATAGVLVVLRAQSARLTASPAAESGEPDEFDCKYIEHGDPWDPHQESGEPEMGVTTVTLTLAEYARLAAIHSGAPDWEREDHQPKETP